jgi:hypothetical protein
MKSIALGDHGHVNVCLNQRAIRKATACPESSRRKDENSCLILQHTESPPRLFRHMRKKRKFSVSRIELLAETQQSGRNGREGQPEAGGGTDQGRLDGASATSSDGTDWQMIGVPFSAVAVR